MASFQAPDPKKINPVVHDNGQLEMTHVDPGVVEFVHAIMGGSRLAVGAIYLWDRNADREKGGSAESVGVPVEITGGQYWGAYGVSNFWDWQLLNPEGRPDGKKYCGYDNIEGQFFGPISHDKAIEIVHSSSD